MIEELMKAVLEGAQQQQQGSRRRQAQPAPSGDILGEILKGVLGGGVQQQSRQAPAQPDMGNLGGIADILGGVLGGGSSRTASTGNPLADMAANLLAERLGISPQIAAMVVSFAMAALLGKKQMQTEQGRSTPSRPSRNTARGGTFDGLDLDDLLDGDFAYESGLAAQLAGKTGQSEDEAAYQLQEAVSILTGVGQRKAKKTAKPKPALRKQSKSGGLDSLLDNWEVN